MKVYKYIAKIVKKYTLDKNSLLVSSVKDSKIANEQADSDLFECYRNKLQPFMDLYAPVGLIMSYKHSKVSEFGIGDIFLFEWERFSIWVRPDFDRGFKVEVTPPEDIDLKWASKDEVELYNKIEKEIYNWLASSVDVKLENQLANSV